MNWTPKPSGFAGDAQQGSLPGLQVDRKKFRQPMRLTFHATEKPIAEPLPRAQLVVEVTDNCPPCERQERDIRRVLWPAAWWNNSYIVFAKADPLGSGVFPKTTLFSNGRFKKQWIGYVAPETLAAEFNTVFNASIPVDAASGIPATGVVAGAIHARDQIQQAVEFVRQSIGEGNSSTFVWDRSAASLNLFHMKDWEAKDLFGLSGRMQFDSQQATGLPIKFVAFAYRLVGRDVVLDMESVTLPGFVSRLNPNQSEAMQAKPYGVIALDDVMLLYSVFCMVRDIFQLLHPSADVMLPEQIVASAVLIGDELTVTFDKSPSIKLVWIFTFSLVVKKVVITDRKIHVEFGGNRFVKSRDFEVQ